MTGTILNGIGIVVGGIVGLILRKPMSMATQLALKGLLGIAMVFVGLRATLFSLGGGTWTVAKQLTILILAMMLGRLIGHYLRLQKGLNRLGRYAKDQLAQAGSTPSSRPSEGFTTAALLFCLAPIAILGAVQDGVNGQWYTLGLKAVLDGLATMALVTSFGWGTIVSFVPVVAYQGTLTLAVRLLAPWLNQHGLVDPIQAVSGMLVFSVALIILDLKKVQVGDYLPSLAAAPVLTWIWR